MRIDAPPPALQCAKLRMPTIRRLLICILLSLLMVGCARQSLLEGLDERQANEVVAVLLHHNISATKKSLGKTGFSVHVADSDLPESIELVQRNDLPSSPRLQVGASFPADAMVSTPLGERARLYSAIEQRLEESLGVLQGVRSARVHVSYDIKGSSNARQAQQDIHIAAVLMHEAGVDELALLQSTKRFLRNTFNDVNYDNVSVVLTPAAPVRVLAATPAAASQGSVVMWGLLALGGVLLLVVSLLLTRGVAQIMAMVRRLTEYLSRRGARARIA